MRLIDKVHPIAREIERQRKQGFLEFKKGEVFQEFDFAIVRDEHNRVYLELKRSNILYRTKKENRGEDDTAGLKEMEKKLAELIGILGGSGLAEATIIPPNDPRGSEHREDVRNWNYLLENYHRGYFEFQASSLSKAYIRFSPKNDGDTANIALRFNIPYDISDLDLPELHEAALFLETNGPLEFDLVQRLKEDYDKAEDLKRRDPTGVVTGRRFVVEPTYLEPRRETIRWTTKPADKPYLHQYATEIQEALVFAMRFGFLRSEMEPENAPDYLAELVRDQ